MLAVPAAPWWQQLAGAGPSVPLHTGQFSFNQMDIRSSQKVLHKTGADAPVLRFPAAILSKHYKKKTPSSVWVESKPFNWSCWFTLHHFALFKVRKCKNEPLEKQQYLWEQPLLCTCMTRMAIKGSPVTLSWRKRASAEFWLWYILSFYGIFWTWWTKLECRSATNHQAHIGNYLCPVSPLSNEDSSFISFTFHLPVPFSVSAHPIITSHYPPSVQSSSHSWCRLGL